MVGVNRLIEGDTNPLLLKSESDAIMLIMGGNFVNSRFSKRAGCGSL